MFKGKRLLDEESRDFVDSAVRHMQYLSWCSLFEKALGKRRALWRVSSTKKRHTTLCGGKG